MDNLGYQDTGCGGGVGGGVNVVGGGVGVTVSGSNSVSNNTQQVANKSKPQHRRLSRATSLGMETTANNSQSDGGISLSSSGRFKSIQPNVRWRSNNNNDPEQQIIEEQSYPSEDFEYMECGPSPPAEAVPSMYDSFEEPSTELSVQICSDTIRINLMEQMKLLSLSSSIFSTSSSPTSTTTTSTTSTTTATTVVVVNAISNGSSSGNSHNNNHQHHHHHHHNNNGSSRGGGVKLLEEIENGNVNISNVLEIFKGTTKNEKNISFLWSVFLKRWDLLEGLIKCGADLNYCDPNGITAIHLAAFSGCVICTSFLIKHKIDVNLQPKCYTPLHCAVFGNSPETARLLIENGADILINTNKQNSEESLLHCAVRANAIECVQLLIDEGADVNSLRPNGTNPIHLAADLGLAQCLKLLLDSPKADANIRISIRDKESTALHLASDEGNVECVNLLLAKGADAKLKNHRGFTALHLAARASSLECIESLLKNGNANPNAEDFDLRTPLHAAISKSDVTFDILETLISWGANVNHKDVFGFTALHLAALDGLATVVEMLIYHGADVTTKSKKGTSALNVITRKTPASLAMIKQKLDAAITLHQSQDTSTREVELELDFRQLLQHCHPREISYLNTFVEEGQKEFLEHPLCSAFLYIKWGKIRKYYIARLAFCFTTVLFLTLYVLTALAHSCYNGSKDMNETIKDQELCQKQSILGDMLRKNPFVIEMQWWVLVVIIIFEIFRKLYGLTGYSSFRHYVTQVENIIEWFVIISVFLTSYIYNKRTDIWQNHIAAFAVLLGWTNLMLMIGQLPIFGVYVAMYTKVQGEFAKLFMAYSCMLVGFTISFCVIFPSNPVFANPLMGFITVLVMMIGEQDLSLLTNEPDGQDPHVLLEISAQITIVLFLLFVTVILMNLLVGIAVHDIQALKKTAELSKLVRQTELISYIESALFKRYLPEWLRKLLHYTALVSPQAYRVVLLVKPLNPGEKRLPREILMLAYDVGKQRKYPNIISTITPTTSSTVATAAASVVIPPPIIPSTVSSHNCRNNGPPSYFSQTVGAAINTNSHINNQKNHQYCLENNNSLLIIEPNNINNNNGVVCGNIPMLAATTPITTTSISNNVVANEYLIDSNSVCSLLSGKIENNADKIEILSQEIRELKSVIHQNHQVIQQLLTVISSTTTTTIAARSSPISNTSSTTNTTTTTTSSSNNNNNNNNNRHSRQQQPQPIIKNVNEKSNR